MQRKAFQNRPWQVCLFDGHDEGRESAHLALLQPASGLQLPGYLYPFGAHPNSFDTEPYSEHLQYIHQNCAFERRFKMEKETEKGVSETPLESVFIRWLGWGTRIRAPRFGTYSYVFNAYAYSEHLQYIH